MDKKKEQLGMNPSTASGKLNKDILFSLVQETGRDFCYQCGEKITRETLSIEHKEPWLDTESPRDNYFDLDNIAYSHLACNVGAARRNRSPCGKRAKYEQGCRCEPCKDSKRACSAKRYTPEKRRAKYLKEKQI
jgi:hypothetical protein